MSAEEFAEGLAEVGFEPDAEYVIGGLDLDNIGEVSCFFDAPWYLGNHPVPSQ